jgi:GT2 family glycosyltransferase/tetratricopeptide (TPR) repeat protein
MSSRDTLQRSSAPLREPQRVTVIVNAENRGFPAAANQGIKAASGSQILLLNNDTLVTGGWLRRLLWALDSDPTIGMVGPCSNFVSGAQQIEVPYESREWRVESREPEEEVLNQFARDWGEANEGRTEETSRLVGFCLLIRREVIEQVGTFDERFGIGNFEDDDYCLRARQAGWKLVIARDAFVHHFGGRTFIGNGVDHGALMRQNARLFHEKWSTNLPNSEPHRPSPLASRGERVAEGRVRGAQAKPDESSRTFSSAHPQPLTATASLSLCMIVRDNERTIRAALESVRPWVDEMVVVDTGSTDRTPEIARELGARVFQFPWCDDFSAARNESLRHALGHWIFWMDSDDTIDAENGRNLRDLARREAPPGVLGYLMQVHCPGNQENGNADVLAVDHVKMFRNRPELRFEGRIHEQILLAIRRAGGTVEWTNIFVVHSGSDQSPEGRAKKQERDLRLLHLQNAEQPDHTFTLFNLGMTYSDMGDYAEAARYLERSIDGAGPEDSHLRKAHALLVQCYNKLGDGDAAWKMCHQGLERFPTDAELQFRRALLLHESGRPRDAAEAYQDLLASQEERHLSSVDRGLKGFRARQNLAAIYAELGQLARAEEEWRRVVEEVPEYRPGSRGLADVLLGQSKYDDALALAERLVGGPLRREGLLLQSEVHTRRGNLTDARRALEQAIAESPDDTVLLDVRCRWLFEHADPADAKRAVEELIRRAPQDGAAYHNLGSLEYRLGQYDASAEAYRHSLALRPDSVSTWVHLGYALRQCGRDDEAVSAWTHALELEPGDEAATAALCDSVVA